MSFNIEVEGGKSVRLPTAGKYCDRDIVVTATGDAGGGYDEGYEAGQKAEYDRFWDNFQNYGNKRLYYRAFANGNWSDETYKPKYKIVCEGDGSVEMFYNASAIIDTKVAIEIYNGTAQNLFTNCKALVNVELLHLENVTSFGSAFTGCSKLKNITISGRIDVNFNISATAVLTNDSVQSIIDHLKDLTGQSQQTLTFHNTVGSKLTDAQKAAITAKNWNLVY